MCTVFYSFSSNIDEVLSIKPSTNVFVFGDFKVHLKDWLTYSSGTDRSCELWYNFSISNDLTQMVNFPTCIPVCDSHSPALLEWQWLAPHWEILIMLLFQFPLTFHHIYNRMPRFITLLMTVLVLIEVVFLIIWDMFHRKVSSNLVLLLLLTSFVSGFRLELIYIYIYIYIYIPC